MKLFYFSPRDLRKNRADCIHIMKTCKVFYDLGWEIVIITPKVFRKENRKKLNELYILYGFEKNYFKIIELPTLIIEDLHGNFFYTLNYQFQISIASFFYLAYLLLFNKIKKNDVIYSKSYSISASFILLKKLIRKKIDMVFEKPDILLKLIHKFVLKNTNIIIVINEFIKKEISNYYPDKKENIVKIDFPSMYDDFESYLNYDMVELRKELNIEEKSIVMYAGKIFPESKEISYILKAAGMLKNVSFYFVGLRNEFNSYFSKLKENLNLYNIKFINYLSLTDFFKYLLISDILVSYYDSFDKLSVDQRVPSKSSLYILTSKPIIFADLPSMRELWDDSQVYFVKPDSPELLAETIIKIFENPIEAKEKAKRCLEFAKRNTYRSSYNKIANEILKIVEKNY
jgi:glycosyltransferase involved in cell wall biosynthesis